MSPLILCASDQTDLSKLNIQSKDLYQAVWSQISFEVNILNQKLNTLIGSQSFLFMAYVMLLNSPEHLRSDFLGTQHTLLIWVFPISAFCMVSFSYLSMISSHLLILSLREHYRNCSKDFTVGKLPSIEADRRLFLLSNASILVLPVILSLAWIILIIQQWRFL